MKIAWLFCSAAVIGCAVPSVGMAQESANYVDSGDIIVTATRRSLVMTEVPLAISAVSADSLRNAGASDIRQLNQLSSSLFVSSSSSEAVGGVARIRGIGTVGDNPGLESSVATFVDGVYRSRSGVALTELGAIDRIEVARGPQGTLFGRNASAGLIHVITKAPSFEEAGTAELSYGNYNFWRAQIGLTGPVNEKIAYRIDGVFTKRDGFMRESNDYTGSSGRRFNNRDRWMVRGQLLFEPSDQTKLRIIGDYSKRDEDCCAASYIPTRNVIRNGDGSISFGPNSMAGVMELFGAKLNQDYTQRRVSVTPGRGFQSDVEDWGVSAELNHEWDDVKFTSISSYRTWKSDRGQDADFNNLDLFYRTDYDQSFKTFSQELRLNGKAFEGTLDWLVGAYYANETLSLRDNLRFGTQYGAVQACRVVAGTPFAAYLSPTQPGCLPALVSGGAQLQLNGAGALGSGGAITDAGTRLINGLNLLYGVNDDGATLDRYKQKDQTWALFTHNVIEITPKLSVTLGARYTVDHKKLDASMATDSTACAIQSATLAPLLTNGVSTVASLANSLIALTCANSVLGGRIGSFGVDGSYHDKRSDKEWTGTAVISYKATDRLLTYLSWSRGFKAGGYNLDRAGLSITNAQASQLRFAAEKVDAWELGAKYRGRGFRLGATAFYQMFDNFQLNTFNGVSFVVENIQGCSALVGGDTADSDIVSTNGACAGKNKSGVVSKGIELEAAIFPLSDVMVEAGYTYAHTGYRHNIAGANGRGLTTALFQLPGSALSNAPRHVVTGSMTWTPPLGFGELRGLFHFDGRYQSDINVGSDLLPEKAQKAFTTINARVGISGKDNGWSLEFWAQNLFNTDYRQTVSGAPIQGSGSLATVLAGGTSPGNALFIAFPGEPRTYGVTVRTKF